MSDATQYNDQTLMLEIDGVEYPMPGMLTGRETQAFQRITGYAWPPTSTDQIGALGVIAYGIIALRRAGITVDENAFLDKPADYVQGKPVDADPPAEAAGA